MDLNGSPQMNALQLISLYMTRRGLNGRLDEENINLEAKTKLWPYLLVDWQCDIQVAYGSLRKAFGRFWLFQEGEAATRLLAHVSDLKQGKEKKKKKLRCMLFYPRYSPTNAGIGSD